VEPEGGCGGRRRKLQMLWVMFRAPPGREQQPVGEGVREVFGVCLGALRVMWGKAAPSCSRNHRRQSTNL